MPKLLFSKKFLLYFLIANVLFLLSNIQIIIRQYYNPPTHINTLQNFSWTHDYYLYLSAINQGAHGSWLFTDTYTSEPTKPGIFYIYYILIGKIGNLIHLTTYFTYHIFRIFAVELFIILTYCVCLLVSKNRDGFWPSIFATLGSIAPLHFFNRSFSAIGQPWWMDFEAIERLNTLAHNMAGFVFLLIAVISLFMYWEKKNARWLLFCVFSIVSGGIIFPPTTTPFLVALPLTFLYLRIRNKITKQKSITRLNVPAIVLVCTCALVSLIVIRYQEQQGFPWNIWTLWNVVRWNIYEPYIYKDIFLIFGLLPLFALPALIHALKSGDEKRLFIAFWALNVYILLPFVNILNIPILRLLQQANYLPWGILTAQSFFDIYNNSRKKRVFVFLCIFFFLSVIPASYRLFNYKVNRLSYSPPDTSLEKSYMATLDFINNNVPVNSVILAKYEGIHIPAFTMAKTYAGHVALTKEFDRKMEAVQKFYTKSWDQHTAFEFIKSNHISYVLQIIDGTELLTTPTPLYSFLTPLYENSQGKRKFIVYKVSGLD